MKEIKRYASIIAGTLFIALSLNIFYKETILVPSGVFGFAIIYEDKVGMDLWLTVLLIDIFFFVFGYLFLNKKYIKRTIIPFTLIPIMIFLTRDINKYIDLKSADMLLMTLYGGVIMGLGFRLIYKNRMLVNGSDIIMLITREIDITKQNIANYFMDALWVVIAIFMYGFEGAMYSLISIVIIEILSKRATLGVSDAKVFYIITKFDKEIRKYILEELGYELTIFDVKGGFLKAKNKVLMCAIPTKDYYKLKEGVKTIDPHAFISITDSYEVINSNKSLRRFNMKI